MLCWLQVLQDESAVPVVAGIPHFQAKLIARHLEKTEQLFAHLQACVCVPSSPSAIDTPIAKTCAEHNTQGAAQLGICASCRGELERVVRSVERAGAHAGQLLTSAGCGTSAPGSCALAAGATPSLAQCVEGLQDIWCFPSFIHASSPHGAVHRGHAEHVRAVVEAYNADTSLLGASRACRMFVAFHTLLLS